MKTVTMLEFRRQAEKIIEQVTRGQRILLTYRGKPVARLEPVEDETADGDDPFYTLGDLADSVGESLDYSSSSMTCP